MHPRPKLALMEHLTELQRYDIFLKLQNGLSKTEIAKLLGVHRSTISRELKRNCDKRSGKYNPELAQRKATERLKQRKRRCSLTEEVKQHIHDFILQDYSPQQVVGWCKRNNITMVSHETIYTYIWALKRKKDTTLSSHLRHRGRNYQKRGNAYKSRGVIPNRKSIDERPKIVDEKQRFGDIEMDCIVSKGSKDVFLTINDRATGVLLMRKLPNREANNIKDAAVEMLMPIKDMLHTITTDNGKEFAMHQEIAKELDVEYYFAHPYHSWERGANENLNGLVRQYFPKGNSFENVTNERVKEVVTILNNRPRKRFNFYTPNEIMKQLI